MRRPVHRGVVALGLTVLAIGFAALLGPAPAEAAIVQFQTTLTRAQVTTSCGSGSPSAAGSGMLTLDTSANTIAFNITFSGLSSAEVGAHIHGPAAPGSPANVLYTLPAGSPKVGTINLVALPGPYTVAQQIADLGAGLWYVQIHSSNCGAGEIRGQILVVPVGGIAELPEVDPSAGSGQGSTPLAQPGSSDSNLGVMAAIAAGAAAFAVTLGGAVVYARRRWLR